MKPYDTDKTPWLFTPHDDGELDEYFSSDHTKSVAETSRSIIGSLSQESSATDSTTISVDISSRSYNLQILLSVPMLR